MPWNGTPNEVASFGERLTCEPFIHLFLDVSRRRAGRLSCEPRAHHLETVLEEIERHLKTLGGWNDRSRQHEISLTAQRSRAFTQT